MKLLSERSGRRHRRRLALIAFAMALPLPLAGAEPTVTLVHRETDIATVMEMLSRTQRVNILLSPEVGGSVSFSLYDMPLDDAIRSIANAAGFAVERRNGSYFVLPPDEAGGYADSEFTEVRLFPVQYADTALVQELLRPYLSSYGSITNLASHKVLMIEDTPEFLDRIAALLGDVDRLPRQILIEARILEITLNKEDSSGLDWARFVSGGDGSFGTRGLSGSGGSASSGFVFQITEPKIEATLTALEQDGRIRTLSTPKLLAIENQEASVIVGDRRGFQVTTTINQVTTESIEFLESGVILRVTPHVDADGRIMMDIHPEVSSGTVDTNGIPSQTTTEVTTRLIVPSGETVFVGGLIKQSISENRNGIPGLGRVPGVGRLFSSRELTSVNTETIVLITPSIVKDPVETLDRVDPNRIEDIESTLENNASAIDAEVAATFREIDRSRRR